MRFAMLDHDGHPVLAQQSGRKWSTSTSNQVSMLDVIRNEAAADFNGPIVVTDQARTILPYRPPTIFGVGLNYYDTVRQMHWDIPTKPFLFPKLSSSVTGPSDAIVVDDTVTTRADWEAELAVIIGTTCRQIAPSNALEMVFGYTAANDVSARDLQAHDGQWVRGKGLDTFCPLGPAVVTRDEIPDPQNLRIRTWLNGSVVQDGSSSDMIFSVAELVSYCSTYFTLRPGDVILTGTPAGCGDFRTPRLALRPGDQVDVEVETIGRLSNQVLAPQHPIHPMQT